MQADPAAIEGIVLIDEVALHLHPALQREIVPRLRAALPRVQWVVSTHSPLVLSGFDSREIVALDREEPDGIRQLDRQIIGFSTDEIVNWLMETPTSSAAMERVLAQQEDENDAQEAIIGQMLRTSPDRSEGEAQSALEDFKRRLARFENDVS
jgi:predicted ATP-binding protein involved in virulence